jgi:hypothetical protein
MGDAESVRSDESDEDSVMSDLLPPSRGGDDDDVMARSIAKSWGIVGSSSGMLKLRDRGMRVGAASTASGSVVRPSYMSAVTATQVHFYCTVCRPTCSL